MLSGAMMHAMGDCTPELSCGCLQPRTDHRAKAEAILEEHGSPNDPHGRAIAHALIAIHDLLAQRLPTARPSRRRRRGLGL